MHTMKMAGIIFSNIYDNTMGELTKHRTMASVPFGGRYRQIDFVLSNMVNSNITTVGVITKYHYQSLMDHLSSRSEWDLNRKNGGLFILPPFVNGQTEVYRGKIEALYGALSFLKKSEPEYVLMADSTNICNIDYEDVLESHIKSGAEVTVVANRAPELSGEEKALVLSLKDGKVSDLMVDCLPHPDDLSGMGMFLVKKDILINMVVDAVAHGRYHFEKDYLQRRFNRGDILINVYEFKGIVLRNDSIASYFQNNFRLMDQTVRDNIFCPESPIYTKVRDEAPTYYGEHAVVDDCLVADGCSIRGRVENCVLFRDVTIGEGSYVKNSIIMQGSDIGRDCAIEYVIMDKDVVISGNRTLVGAPTSPLIISKGESI